MQEIISIHLGQAGVQIGNACWELISLEHGIRPDGSFPYDHHFPEDKFETFFDETQGGRYAPRAIVADLEPTVIDEIRNGIYRHLFDPDQLITGCDDAASNYGRGYYTVGRLILDQVMEKIRVLVNNCESLAGFFIYHSFGGGTGSGFTALLVNTLQEEFGKQAKLQFAVYPSPRLSVSMVEPYNAVLSTYANLEATDCCFMVDNEAIYEICADKFNLFLPSYADINQLIAQIASSITTSIRFEGSLNVDILEFQTNLVPYPRIHFPMVAYSPLLPCESNNHQNLSVRTLTEACFLPSNQLLKCDPTRYTYLSSCLLYRGDVSPKDIYDATARVKKNEQVHFVSWCPTGFKIGLNYQPPTVVPQSFIPKLKRSVCMIANTTAIKEVWARLDRKFDLMFMKRAFVKWYEQEGVEEDEFWEARMALMQLEDDYAEAGRDVEFPSSAPPPSVSPQFKQNGDNRYSTTTSSPSEGSTVSSIGSTPRTSRSSELSISLSAKYSNKGSPC